MDNKNKLNNNYRQSASSSLPLPEEISPEALNDFLSAFKVEKQKRILSIIDYLLTLSPYDSTFHSRQREIGDVAGISRVYTNRLFHELKCAGIVWSIKQKSNYGIYQLNEGFFGHHRTEFAKIFPALKAPVSS